MYIFRYLIFSLVLIGALNWGLVGFFDFDLVSAIFGDMTVFTRVIYSLVGLSAITSLFFIPKCEC